MANNVDIKVCKEGDHQIWDEFVFKSSFGTISHLFRWREIINRTYGHDSFYLMALEDGQTKGVLPIIWVNSRLMGNVLTSMPYQDYGGIAAENAEAESNLLEHAISIKQRCGALNLELRQQAQLNQNEFKMRKNKASLILDISSGPESVWKSFSGKVRNQIRKAQKSGLSTKLGGAELLNEFYCVFAANMRDLGSPVHPPSFFSNIFSEFRQDARLLIVRDGHRTIGGMVCLFCKTAILVPWASSLRKDFSKCPNNLLYWDAIQHACDRGCKRFDFGRSSIDSGTYNFKLQWGAVPVQLYWHYFTDGHKWSDSPENSAKYRIAAAIWKRLPVRMTVMLGPYIRQYLTQ